MRGRPLNFAMIGRAAGFALVAGAIVATASYFRHDDPRRSPPLPRPSGARQTSIQSDPLAREVAHCQAISMATKDDAACDAAWAETRRRFFTYRPAPSAASTPPANPRVAPQPEDH